MKDYEPTLTQDQADLIKSSKDLETAVSGYLDELNKFMSEVNRVLECFNSTATIVQMKQQQLIDSLKN